MPSNVSTAARQYWAGLRVLLVLTVLLGLLYPLLVTGVGQLFLRDRANGSLVSSDGHVVGSNLLGQLFTDDKGDPLPQWFQPRPSAAGAGYDGVQPGSGEPGPREAHR
jgi:potassium-transporting ATPase KdpC subunit